MKKYVVPLLMVGLGVALAGTPKNAFVEILQDVPATLDPSQAYDTGSSQLVENVYEQLLGYRTHLVSFHDATNRLNIKRIKHTSKFAFAFNKSHSKFFTKLLHRSTQAFVRSITQRIFTGTKPDFPHAAFSAFEGLAECSNRIFFMIPGYTCSKAV